MTMTIAEQMDFIVSRSGKLDPREQRRAQLRREKAREDKKRARARRARAQRQRAR